MKAAFPTTYDTNIKSNQQTCKESNQQDWNNPFLKEHLGIINTN
jgi:hypothetical protein